MVFLLLTDQVTEALKGGCRVRNGRREGASSLPIGSTGSQRGGGRRRKGRREGGRGRCLVEFQDFSSHH